MRYLKMSCMLYVLLVVLVRMSVFLPKGGPRRFKGLLWSKAQVFPISSTD